MAFRPIRHATDIAIPPIGAECKGEIMCINGDRRYVGRILAVLAVSLIGGSAPTDAADAPPQIAAGPTSERQRVPEGNYEAGQWQLPAGLVDLRFIVTTGPGTDIQLTFDAKQVVEEPGQAPKEKRACYSAQTSTIQQVPGQWTVRLRLVPC